MIGWSWVGRVVEGGRSDWVVSQMIGHNWRGYYRLNNCGRGGELTLGLVLGNVVNDRLGLAGNGSRRVVNLPCGRGIARISDQFFDFLDQVAKAFTQFFHNLIIGRIIRVSR